MKNFFKVFGVIALTAVIGFSFAACGGGDDGGGGSGTGGGTGITIESALVGTWVGDAGNGTLVFSSTGVNTPDQSTKAWGVVYGFNQLLTYGGTFVASNGKVIATYQAYNDSFVYLFYTINNNTLTMNYSDEDDDTKIGDIAFVGVKQSGGPGTVTPPVTGGGINTWTGVDVSSIFGGIVGNINAVVYDNNKFVAGGNQGKMAYSSDGITWTAVADSTFPTIYNISTIAYGNGKFVAGGINKIAYSSDGITWTAVTNSTFESYIYAIAYGNGKFVAVGANEKMAYSSDGVTWTAVTKSPFTNSNDYIHIYAIAYGNGMFVAGGKDGKMATSPDGVNWTAVADSGIWVFVTSGGDSSKADISSIVYSSNKFVAGGSKGNIAYSADGITWTAVDVLSIFSDRYITLAYGNGKFLAGANHGKMAYSADGVRWTALTTNFPFTGQLDGINAIAYGNGTFVAVCSRGRMAYSTGN